MYRLLSKKPFNGRANYNGNLVAGENLSVLKQRLKVNHPVALNSKTRLATEHLALGNSLIEVVDKYGRPAHINTHKIGGVRHDVVLYKRIMRGLKSRVIYNFINETVASVTFQISVATPEQLNNVNEFITQSYLDGDSFPSENQFTVLDSKGNKLDYTYTFDVKLTFINNDAEIIQNINAALYQNRYSHEKYVPAGKFQLSM